ncbi:MAG: tryptophan synthase subunit alpha [Gammaproteobacteria bacterium]|nr:tryptophan synthase subunit alpha [Gammaproteobacteria bacterium]
MSRLCRRFTELRGEGRAALVCFITAGDGGMGLTLATMHAMVEAGADIIELGVPFSDPMADGPSVQLAGERALAGGTRVADVFKVVRDFRQRDNATPIVLMGYLNPIEAQGAQAYASAASAAGVDGVIIVDLPPEEGEETFATFKKHGIDPIMFVAPTTTQARMRMICDGASGFIYLVSIKGVTGTRQADAGEVAVKAQQVRAVTDLPIAVGFGIKDRASAAAMAGSVDAVIVGSALVDRVGECVDDPQHAPGYVAQLVSELRAGVEEARRDA